MEIINIKNEFEMHYDLYTEEITHKKRRRTNNERIEYDSFNIPNSYIDTISHIMGVKPPKRRYTKNKDKREAKKFN